MTESNDGEMDLILRDLRQESESIMHELSEVEDELLSMRKGIENDTISKSELIETINDLRKKSFLN